MIIHNFSKYKYASDRPTSFFSQKILLYTSVELSTQFQGTKIIKIISKIISKMQIYKV